MNGLFYGDDDYTVYDVYAVNPGRAVLYYFLDGTTLYAALVLSHNVNDNVFGEKNCNTGLDGAYLGTADTGDPDTDAWCPGPGHSFNDLIKSDHSEWNLFCGGSHWQWFQDLLYAVDSNGNQIKEKDIPDDPSAVHDWLSDPYGSDGGGTPPSSLLESASSIQWNMRNSTWDVSGLGVRGYDEWKSPDDTYGTPGTDNDVTDNGYQDTTLPYFWTDNSGPSSDAEWEWLVVYEVKLDISECGGVPFTLWPVTGHNSPAKDDLGENVPFYDMGDLPDTASGTGTGNYETLRDNGGPVHMLVGNLRIGDIVDADPDGQPNAAADGDDTNPAGLSDDEDGVTVSDLTNMTPGDPATVHVKVTNETGSEATLYGFIDFNGDGDFDDTVDGTPEATSVTVPDGTVNGMVVLDFGTVPTVGYAPNTYARFRLTTDTGIGPNGAASDGEVEDYPVSTGETVEQRDFGDAPDSYGTYLASNGARHIISSGFHLGPAIDAESDGQPGSGANGDDLNGTTPDDEDGVNFTSSLQPGSSSNALSVGLSGTGLSGKVDAWIDFNGNGVFDHPAEHLNGGTSWDVTSGSNPFTYTIPADAVPGATYARFRLSTAGSLQPTGAAADGEVEDYPVTIAANPDVDIEKATNGDDADAPPGPNVPVGSTVTWTYVVTNTGNVTLYDLVVTDDKITNDASEIDCGGGNNTIASLAPGASQGCTATGTAVDTSGMQDGAYENTGSVVGWTVDGGTGTQVSDSDPSHYNASTGDVFDFGDAPDTYGTLLASSGAYHRIRAAAPFSLGAAIDQEPDGQPGSGADGDDNNDTDDEDGITLPAQLVAGQEGCFLLTAVTPSGDAPTGKLDAWVDFNGNGAFDHPAEHLFGGTSWNVAAGGVTDVEVCFSVPAGASSDATFARFRLSEGGGLPPTGYGGDGEVEDYAVTILVPAIDIEKATNGEDADDPTGPVLKPEDAVTWTYVVTNTGDVPLTNVVVVDDAGTPGDAGDDFEPIFVGGDDGNDGVLSPGEVWTYEAMGTAVPGQYENLATVTAQSNDESMTEVTDSDPSHYVAGNTIIPSLSGWGLALLAVALVWPAGRAIRRRKKRMRP